MSVFILNLEEPSFSSTVCIICSITFLVLVFLDKKIKFHKMIDVEHMLRMKKFSNSEIHFKRSIFLYIGITAILVLIFKKIFIYIYPNSDLICTIFINKLGLQLFLAKVGL